MVLTIVPKPEAVDEAVVEHWRHRPQLSARTNVHLRGGNSTVETSLEPVPQTMYFSQTESSKWSLNFMSNQQGQPFTLRDTYCLVLYQDRTVLATKMTDFGVNTAQVPREQIGGQTYIFQYL